MKLICALDHAMNVKNVLGQYCKRIEIAGSIRRKCPEVNDIEIVCIPDIARWGFQFGALVKSWPKIRGEPTGKYTRRHLPCGMELDLFMCQEGNWGLIYLIRTGSASFSKRIIGIDLPKKGCHSEGGWIYKGTERIETREEVNVFDLLGMTYSEPEKRLW